MGNRVLIMSDVSLGHGVPQLVSLAMSLSQAPDTRVRIVEPDMKGAIEIEMPGVEIMREITLLPPNHPSFAVAFARACREHIERFRPDTVVATSGFMVLALATSSWKAARTIYYAFENKDHQVAVPPYTSVALCDFMAAEVNWIFVPEENRAALDYPRAVREGRVVVVHNACPAGTAAPRTPAAFHLNEQQYLRRNPDVAAAVANQQFASGTAHYLGHGRRELRPLGSRHAGDCRFLMAGTLSRRSLLQVFAQPDLEGIQVDIFGVPSDQEAESILREACQRHPGVRHGGLIPNAELRRISPQYSYRLVFWGDTGVNELFACPNKLFEAIADGLPVIATPQPQIREVLSSWGCGLLSDDWSVGSVAAAIRLGRVLYETEAYDQFLLNTQAARQRLNWQSEFEKIRDILLPAPVRVPQPVLTMEG